uniref:Small RNA 2'-O-methyltransferase n=1 Tax=Plectus sambesii TaxID=2011161 RepID=A0A914W8D4_9BILA
MAELKEGEKSPLLSPPKGVRFKRRTKEVVMFSDTDESVEGAEDGDDTMQREESGIRFRPPLYRQRYDRCIEIIAKHKNDIKTVVDFGCAECQWMKKARFVLTKARMLIGVDLDEQLLNDYGVETLSVEHLTTGAEAFFIGKRPAALTVQLFAGSIGEFDNRLADVDAVVAIEIIEHLPESTLQQVPLVVFGKIRPKVAIFTTPNGEFNPLFDMGPNHYRHDDHKFEWTRAEFRQWCESVVAAYPDYSVTYDGVGEAPADDDFLTDLVGYCSQIAVFVCADYADMHHRKLTICPGQQRPYKKLLDVTYPFDPCGTRFDRVKSAIRNACYDIIDERRDQLTTVKVGAKGESLAVPLDEAFARFPEELLMFAKTKWQAANIACDDKHWKCTSHAKLEMEGFDSSYDLDPPGFILVPITEDYGSDYSTASDREDVDAAIDSWVQRPFQEEVTSSSPAPYFDQNSNFHSAFH